MITNPNPRRIIDMILSKRSANFNMVFVYQLTYQHRSPIFYLLAEVQPPLISKHGFTIRKFVLGSHAPDPVFHFSAIVTTWKQLIVVSKSSCPFFSFCLPQYIQVGMKTSISTLETCLLFFLFYTVPQSFPIRIENDLRPSVLCSPLFR